MISPAAAPKLKISRPSRDQRHIRYDRWSPSNAGCSLNDHLAIHNKNPMNAAETLNREFLEVRARILEIAAALDRLDRAEGSVADDPRLARIHQALARLESNQSDRAEQIQLIFSLPYDKDWRETPSRGAGTKWREKFE